MHGVKESEDDLNFLFRKMVSKTMVKGMMASLVICRVQETVNGKIQRQEEQSTWVSAFWVHAYLVEANRVESEAEVEEANGDAVEQPEGDDGPRVDRLGLEEAQPLRDVQREEGHHQVPARQRRRCITSDPSETFRKLRCNASTKTIVTDKN